LWFIQPYPFHLRTFWLKVGHSSSFTHSVILAELGLMILPVVSEIVGFVGFEEDRDAEADLWTESRAMARLGWSETRWRQWLCEMAQEKVRRNQWWDETVRWFDHMEVDVVDLQTRCQERVLDSMAAMELERRLLWGKRIRADLGYGEDFVAWQRRTAATGDVPRWGRMLGSVWVATWMGSRGSEYGSQQEDDDAEMLSHVVFGSPLSEASS
jgi:hypothetical protein